MSLHAMAARTMDGAEASSGEHSGKGLLLVARFRPKVEPDDPVAVAAIEAQFR